MYVYIRSEAKLWTVGFYDPSGVFQPESDWPSPEKAEKRVHFLNGGKDEAEKVASPIFRDDPYPEQLLLTRVQVAKLFALTVSEFRDFRPAAGFPEAITVGTLQNGRPRLRWRKTAVYCWFDEVSRRGS